MSADNKAVLFKIWIDSYILKKQEKDTFKVGSSLSQWFLIERIEVLGIFLSHGFVVQLDWICFVPSN